LTASFEVDAWVAQTFVVVQYVPPDADAPIAAAVAPATTSALPVSLCVAHPPEVAASPTRRPTTCQSAIVRIATPRSIAHATRETPAVGDNIRLS
jgi:hypothetical protein